MYKDVKESSPLPPRLAQKFLLWFLKEELAEEVQGDLEEQFYDLLEKKSLWKAQLNYWYQVFHYLRPFALKAPNIINHNHISMYKNYIIVAWRNLLKYKLYSAIKIGGFALGIAACFLIFLFVMDELSYDHYYPKKDRVYRLINVATQPDAPSKWPACQPPIKKVLEEEYPEVEKVARMIPYDWSDAGDNQVRPEGRKMTIYEEGFVYADPELLTILDIDMVYGNNQKALSQPNSIVISRRKADKYFPGEDPVGRVIILNENDKNPYRVGGVMENFPHNSHLEAYDFLISLVGQEFWPGEQSSWCCNNYHVYIQVNSGTDPILLEEKLLGIRDKYMIPYFEERGNQIAKDIKNYFSYTLQPISDIHLRSQDIEDFGQRGDIRVVWLFGMIAGLILLLAIINFINIATAKSANRAKEVGLRKVIGSYRIQLINHFLTESILFSFASFIFGIIIVNLTLPIFNQIAGKSLVFPWTAWWFLPLLLLSIFLVGILAGIYPAFYLSAFRPIQVLKGSLSKGVRSSKLRNVLVVFQFTTSVVLIISAFVVNRQMNYILNKKLGYDKDQVLIIQGTNTLEDRMDTFKEEILKLSAVKHVTFSNYLPVSGTKRDGNQFWKDGREKLDAAVNGQIWRVDEDYISTLGMKVIEGRNFDPKQASDTAGAIINQVMAKELGLENPIIGKRISNGYEAPYHVIGIVEDFHFESMQGKINPLALVNNGQGNAQAAVKIQSSDMQATVKSVRQIWDQFIPNQPIRYSFMDDRFAMMYEDVERTEKIFNSFAFLAIVVACIGLFALSSFMAEQRRKEISIRKVLGASGANLFKLLTFRFLRLILLSLIIALPLGWYLMREWLRNYEYSIKLSWDVFVFASLVILAIALFTISYESIRVIRTNPTESLKAE